MRALVFLLGLIILMLVFQSAFSEDSCGDYSDVLYPGEEFITWNEEVWEKTTNVTWFNACVGPSSG